MSPRHLAAAPADPVAVPRAVAGLADGDFVEPVWRNELDGLTFRLTGGDGVRYVKWVPAGTPELDLAAEAERIAWAGRFTPVPTVLDIGRDATGEWLLTSALPGRSAVDRRWLAEPGKAARAIGSGLRALHDALPTDECPFSWSAEDRIARLDAHRRPEVADVPAVDRLVVCHGDACAPNTLLDDSGFWIGHVDLGSLGVADRWADIAIAGYSLEWNYGDGYEDAFFDAYRVVPDNERISYYRRLWDLG